MLTAEQRAELIALLRSLADLTQSRSEHARALAMINKLLAL